MKVNDIFLKPVERHIEGVIKADDNEGLLLEVEEYVITNEIQKSLELFFDAYNNYEGANGVWISGFFGSGKSHLLKMLALLLENDSIDNKCVLDYFLEKCGDNEILKGDIKKAVAIPSKSILFNIDQKADTKSKTEMDALIAVFMKVFDENCGYYGKQAYIAQFERELDRDGFLKDFKDAFKELSGQEWEWARRRSKRMGEFIDKVYNNTTGSSTENILDKYRADYTLSIEDFAEHVNEYINAQNKNFRLNFLVDEVGQYVADNRKLMLNLQTVAESLATKCRGRAWVIVTSQEDMNTLLGDLNKSQSNDFSRIQARFTNRVKLTSTDVEEVIRKRLLTKNDEGINTLSSIYHSNMNNFKTLFSFSDGGQTYKHFKDRDHFIHSYPFIPYQFILFQSAIQSLSQHNAFEGKHSSVGERSMLGVFQDVVLQIKDGCIGELASFDLMFEGIRAALKTSIHKSIIIAEKNLENQFAVKLLKTLFLVKYVREFKSTIRNLSTLMTTKFDEDINELNKRIEEALDLLESQIYIQRNGDIFEFLTDEEKDIEREIKETSYDSDKLLSDLSDIIFDDIIKNRKIKCLDSNQEYDYTRKLDDSTKGKEYELSINIITPFHEHSGNDSLIRMQSMGKDELIVAMPSDNRLYQDMVLYEKTAKYIKNNPSVTNETVKRILAEKSIANDERKREITDKLLKLLSTAKFFINGSDIEIAGSDPQTKIVKGFSELISRVYPNIKMLRGINYTDNDISNILNKSEESLFTSDVVAITEPEQDILGYIQTNNRSGLRTTIKNLTDKFNKKPYGWYKAAILCNLAKLCSRGKVEVRSDSNILEDSDLENALRNTHFHANVILNPQVDVTPSQIRVLKNFYEDFFDEPPIASEAKALGKETLEKVNNLFNRLNNLYFKANEYPFIQNLKPVITLLKEAGSKSYTWFFTDLNKVEDEFIDKKERFIDPILRFMGTGEKPGELIKIYDDAKEFIKNNDANLVYIKNEDISIIKDILGDNECYIGNKMQTLKVSIEKLKKEVTELLNNEKNSSKASIDSLKSRLQSMDEFEKLTEQQKSVLNSSFDIFSEQIQNQSLLAVIKDLLRNFEDIEYQNLLNKMCHFADNNQKEKYKVEGDDRPVKPEESHETRSEYVAYRTLNIPYSKAWLGSESDVDDYLKKIKETLMKEISEGKKIQI